MPGGLGSLRIVVLLMAALSAGCVTVVTPGDSPLASLAPTATSTTPGATSTAGASATPTAAASAAPTVEPTRSHKPRGTREPRPTDTPAPTTDITPPPTPTPEPVPQATLNLYAPDRYGYVFLASGVFDDPNTVAVTSGGPVDVGYVGRQCSGYAAIAADYRVAFQQADPPLAPSSLLRFYFVGPRDTSLIVARGDFGTGANMRWFCADDSFGTFNPAYDFHDPPSGIYHVWVASAEPGDYVPGTLYVTTNNANHP